MVFKNTSLFYIFAFFCLFLLLALFFVKAEAQTAPHLFLSWNAHSYVPPDYKGKALPTGNTFVNLGLDVFDAGKSADLSSYNILWSLGENVVQTGKGLDRITLKVPPSAGRAVMQVRAQIRGYKGQTLLKIINIPVVPPETVVVSPYPGDVVPASSFSLKGLPYFFNVTSLSGLVLGWKVNEESPDSLVQPDTLTVNVNKEAAPGSSLRVRFSASNPARQFESAVTEKALTYQP